MVIRIITEWKNGKRQENTINSDAQRGRYLFASRKVTDSAHYLIRDIKNGYQYDTPSCNTFPYGGCTTTVTLERGWA